MLAILIGMPVLAASTQAAQFTTFNTSTSQHESGKLTITPTSSSIISPTPGAWPITCDAGDHEASIPTGTETEPTFIVGFASCHIIIAGSTFIVDARVPACDTRHHITSGSGDEFTGTIDIVCTAGHEIEFETTTASGKETKCLMKIGSQNGLGPEHWNNITVSSPRDIQLAVTAENLRSTTSGGLLNCGVANGEHTTGKLEIASTMRAYNTSGTQIDLTIQ